MHRATVLYRYSGYKHIKKIVNFPECLNHIVYQMRLKPRHAEQRLKTRLVTIG